MEIVSNLTMAPLQRPLLNRRSLLPGESLPSLLARLKNANYYEAAKTLKRICEPHLPFPDNLNQPLQADTFRVLAEMTRLSPLELYQASDHSFAPVFTWQEAETRCLPSGEKVWWLSVGMRHRYILSVEDAQYCPPCLAENPYHRWSWLNQLTAVCPIHHCLLQQKCPACSLPLSVQDVVNQQCRRCQHPLHEMSPESVEKDTWGLFTQQLIQSWWSDVTLPPFPTDSLLLDKPIPFLLELLRGLVYALVQNPQMALCHRPAFPSPQALDPTNPTFLPAHIYILYATALKGLINWPDGFYRFMDAIRHTRDLQPTLTQELGVIYTSWLERGWHDPAFQFVQDAFNHYLRHHCPMSSALLRLPRVRENAIFADLWPFITDLKASQRLSVPLEAIWELVNLGQITPYHQVYPDAPATHANLIKAADVEVLYQQWGMTTTVKNAAAQLQTIPEIVLALCHLGILRTSCLPISDENARWRVNMADVEDLYLQLRQLTRLKQTEPVIDLKEAARLWGTSSLDVAQVIQAVVKRQVRAHSKGRLLDGMYVVKQDVERLFADKDVPEFPVVASSARTNEWDIF